MGDLLTAFGFVVVVLAIYRYHRAILDGLRRFDARNVKRIRDEQLQKTDPHAHFKQTLRTAEEQVEDVGEIEVLDERLGTPVTRYLFEGEQYATREDADDARADKIRAIARGYYMELPKALAERRSTDTLH